MRKKEKIEKRRDYRREGLKEGRNVRERTAGGRKGKM